MKVFDKYNIQPPKPSNIFPYLFLLHKGLTRIQKKKKIIVMNVQQR